MVRVSSEAFPREARQRAPCRRQGHSAFHRHVGVRRAPPEQGAGEGPGDPLPGRARPPRLAERFDSRGFLIYTTGSLIDEDIADRMMKVGNMFPAISVEGGEHLTDARRGKGVYRQNREIRRMLAERGVMTGFSATVTRENCR